MTREENIRVTREALDLYGTEKWHNLSEESKIAFLEAVADGELSKLIEIVGM